MRYVEISESKCAEYEYAVMKSIGNNYIKSLRDENIIKHDTTNTAVCVCIEVHLIRHTCVW